MANRASPQPEPWGDDPESRPTTDEQYFQAGTRWTKGDDVRVRKWVETDPFHQQVDRNVGVVQTDHAPPDDIEDGEVHELADGSLSIPVFEEQIVVSRRTVVRERVLLRRHIVAETVEVNEEVRREDFDIEAVSPDVELAPRTHTAPFPGSSTDLKRKA